jgi:uncharacterized protein with HEPN domain
LCDIRDAIGGIQQVVAGVAFDGFAKSWGMQRAVERGLEIISEPADMSLATSRRSLRVFPGGRSQRSAICSDTIINAPTSWRRGTFVREHLPALATAIEQLITEAERREQG